MILDYVLCAVWIAGILPILIAFIPSSKLNAFHSFVLGLAKRGKIMQSSSQRFTVPQKYFCHFYILAAIWTTILLVSTWMYAYRTAPRVYEPLLYSRIASHLTGLSHELWYGSSSPRKNKYMIWRSVFLLLLMEAQVLRRLFESIYLFKYSPSARMHIFGYLTGLIFYTAAPLSLCSKYAPEVFHFVTNLGAEFVVKGKDRMKFTEYDVWGHVDPLFLLKWYVWLGAAVFSFGWFHQYVCHAILGSLRENDEQYDYAIPHGDWFDYVSSAHYLAEIVIYGGLVIASGFSDVTILLLFGFVVANLSLAAAETHKWYLHKFDNYPKNRYVIIPFIY
ncbi:polyprenol reductase 2-like [Dorcoceras hygrometricum]|uniref:Polyprenol reductase 2-like n=1 Tax=Dorcoceras hygrometricum TaxID=472368 RepID=A0A2Z7D2H4_9LAMI|nr:polyprenol reductase 2-like [Dorcoceras hygrometricum]